MNDLILLADFLHLFNANKFDDNCTGIELADFKSLVKLYIV